MPAFPRTVVPSGTSWPSLPTGVVSVSRSGKVQRRTTMQVGAAWTETYAPARRSDAVYRNWLALVTLYYSQQTAVTVYPYGQRTLLGAGGGTPLVNGGSQTGASLITDGWPNATLVLKAGDVFTIAGQTLVRTVTADATTNGSGQVTLSINPPIYAGGSPSDNAPLTIASGSVLYTAFIESLTMPTAGADELYSGLTIAFRELP